MHKRNYNKNAKGNRLNWKPFSDIHKIFLTKENTKGKELTKEELYKVGSKPNNFLVP